jgi:hypothetical protein
MATDTQYPESDARHHTSKIGSEIEHLVENLRADIGKVSDPKAQALFETSAEVRTGLKTAFKHYEQGEELAWKRGA